MPKSDFVSIPTHCTLCPRRCGADRAAGRTGFCGAGGTLKAARAALHYWEEPCISGTKGSGTVFFSGCTLKCCFCQNYPISAEGLGKEITVEHLAEIFLNLQAQGAHNINLVTPGQWRPWIIAALDIAREKGLRLPIVCNTGGYETVESVEAWRGYIDIWLADLKYVSSALSAELSSAPDYFAQAKPAIEAMMAQAGHPVFDADGILQRGRAFAGRNVSRRSGGNRGRNGRRGRREAPARRSNARIRGRQGRPGGRTRLLQAAAAAQGIGDDPLELAVDRAELVGSP